MVSSLADELFLLQTMGDDRAIVETYVAGRPAKTMLGRGATGEGGDEEEGEREGADAHTARQEAENRTASPSPLCGGGYPAQRGGRGEHGLR